MELNLFFNGTISQTYVGEAICYMGMFLNFFCLVVAHFGPSPPQSNWNQIVDSFDEMNLREALLRGIYAYGFEKPSAIQQRAIIPCIKGK